MADLSLPSAMTPFQLLFGRSRRISIDMLVPQVNNTENTEGFANLIDEHRHNLRDVREALERLHEGTEKARQRRNASIQPPSAGTRAVTGTLVLARENGSSLHRQGRGLNWSMRSGLTHGRWWRW